MIPNEAFGVLSEKALAQLSELFDNFYCPECSCWKCPFALEHPYKTAFIFGSYICAFGYANELHRRLTK